jgi:hypothetical protein
MQKTHNAKTQRCKGAEIWTRCASVLRRARSRQQSARAHCVLAPLQCYAKESRGLSMIFDYRWTQSSRAATKIVARASRPSVSGRIQPRKETGETPVPLRNLRSPRKPSWTVVQIDTDLKRPASAVEVFIRVHPCLSVVKSLVAALPLCDFALNSA